MKPTYKILHTEASDGWGGQEIRIFNEMKWMRDQGHQMLLAAPSHAKIYQRCHEAGFKTYAVTFQKKTQFSDFFRLISLLRKLRPDVVSTHSSVDSWVTLAAASLLRHRCRIRYRHVSTGVKPSSQNRYQYNKLCNYVITTADCIRDQIIRDLSVHNKRISTLFTGIEVPEKLIDKESARIELCNELNVPKDTRFVGMVAVLRSWKGHPYLIRGFDQFAKDHAKQHLLIAGDGPQLKNIQQQIEATQNRDRIHLLGHRENPWSIFRAMDVAFLTSTRNEGIPQSGLYAMHSETAFVGTVVGGIPEIIQDNKTGLLIEEQSATAICHALERLTVDDELRKGLSQRAKEWALSHAGIDSMGSKTEQIISRIIEDRVQ